MIYSWQTVNLSNLGEQVCRPTDYFALGEVKALSNEDPIPADGPVIFGASGLLYPEIRPVLERAVSDKKQIVIGWGIGHNTHYGTEIDYPDWLGKFDLVGLRDWGTDYNYTPCPSCMHEAFDEVQQPTQQLVVYDQIDYPVALTLEQVPRMNNYHPRSEMADVVRFLASGRTILTSSYHGAYWGRLLGRNVLVWKPWSTKFLKLEPPVRFVDESNWTRWVSSVPAEPGYLEKCRALNAKFAARVKALIS